MATNTSNAIRPTKKQRELLSFIEQFIAEHGYSPSYREIMNGLNYTSVATVSLHVTSLIRRGHLRKRDRSARSLEVVPIGENAEEMPATDSGLQNNWLVDQVQAAFVEAESAETVTPQKLDDLRTLVGAVRILGFAAEAQQFEIRLQAISGNEEE